MAWECKYICFLPDFSHILRSAAQVDTVLQSIFGYEAFHHSYIRFIVSIPPDVHFPVGKFLSKFRKGFY